MLKVSIKESRGSEFESNHYHTMRQKPNAKDLNKTEIHKFFWKSKVYNSKASKPTSDINFPLSGIFRLGGYQVITFSGDIEGGYRTILRYYLVEKLLEVTTLN